MQATIAIAVSFFLVQCKTTDSSVRSEQGDQLKAAFNEEVAAGRDCAVKTAAPILMRYATARQIFIASLNSIDIMADKVLESIEFYRRLKIAERNGQQVDFEPAQRAFEASIQPLRDHASSFAEKAQQFATQRERMAAFASECVPNQKYVGQNKAKLFDKYKEKAFECQVSGDFPTSVGLFAVTTKQTGPISFTQRFCNHTFKMEFESNFDYSKLSLSKANQVRNIWEQCAVRETLPDRQYSDNRYNSLQDQIENFCRFHFKISKVKGGYKIGPEFGSYLIHVNVKPGDIFEEYTDTRYYTIDRGRVKDLRCGCTNVWPDDLEEEMAKAMVKDEDLVKIRTRYAESLDRIEQNLGAYLDFLRSKTRNVLEQTREIDLVETKTLQNRLKNLEDELEGTRI